MSRSLPSGDTSRESRREKLTAQSLAALHGFFPCGTFVEVRSGIKSRHWARVKTISAALWCIGETLLEEEDLHK